MAVSKKLQKETEKNYSNYITIGTLKDDEDQMDVFIRLRTPVEAVTMFTELFLLDPELMSNAAFAALIVKEELERIELNKAINN